MHYFQYTAVKFNHDVIQLPFWALAGYAFHAGLRRGRIGHWLLLGFAVGMALWAKYFVVVLATPFALFLLFDRDARRALATPGPWLALAVALIIMAPHLIWLVQTDFLPFAYAEPRAAPYRGWYDHLITPRFSPPARSSSCCRRSLLPPRCYGRSRRRRSRSGADAFDRRIVTLLAFGPGVAMIRSPR